MNLKVEIFLDFQKKIRNGLKKTEYFNIEFVSYCVNIQPDIMQNW
jgi:DNA-dependent RNA polymerase auxiliary subunit epsilon